MVSWTNGMLFMVGVWLEYLSKIDHDFSIPRINKWVFSWCAAKHSFSRKRKKEKSFFTTSPTHCSEMLLNLKPKSHFWLYKRYKCLIFFRCMNLFDYRLYVFHTLFGTVLLTGPKNSLVTRGAARKYVICWRVKNIQREKICQHKGRLEKLSNFFLWRKAGEKVNFLLPIHSQYVVPHTHIHANKK